MGGELSGHTETCQSVQHFVVREIKWFEGVISRAMAAKGWQSLGMFQGKISIQRVICRNCVRKQEDVTEIDAYKRKKGLEAEGDPEMTLYQILCN